MSSLLETLAKNSVKVDQMEVALRIHGEAIETMKFDLQAIKTDVQAFKEHIEQDRPLNVVMGGHALKLVYAGIGMLITYLLSRLPAIIGALEGR